MTLSPVDSRDVKGVPSTRYKINPTCAHPECAEPSEPGAHHAFRRSQIIGDSYFVSIDGGDPIPHAVGLCSEHHRQITDNQAWIRLVEDSFVWYDEDGYGDDGLKGWRELGPLDPQPSQLQKSPRQRAKKVKGEGERRPSQVLSVRCPKDAAEDGVALLRELIAQAGEKIGRDPDCPIYFVLMEVLAVFVRDAVADA